MKNILITGVNSFIGRNMEAWLKNYPEKYKIESLSVRDESWNKIEFCKYDVIFHVAGVAHVKETKANMCKYYEINRDLTYDIATKAKLEGVNQFIFLSSMSVYGIECGMIDKNTVANPKTNYGKSKHQAEKLILTLAEDSFKVAILRVPMVYGKGCKGNYSRLSNLALRIPAFPEIKNKRSMIYIGNLCEFVRALIDKNSEGMFLPQNEDYVCTSDLVRMIAEVHGKKIRMTKLFNPIIQILLRINVSTIIKLFGNLTYSNKQKVDVDVELNNFVNFKESVFLAESEGK